MAYFELDATQFVRIRCSSQRSSVAEFCRIVAKALGVQSTAEVAVRKLLREAAHSVAATVQQKGERVIIVLEDADWLVTLTAGEGDAAEVEAARDLWTELAELAAADVVGVVATTVRGFQLQRRVIDRWENPLATHLVPIQLHGMTVDGIGRIACDLGAGVGVGFEDAAVARIHEWSGGHVDLARRICDRLVDAPRASGPLAWHTFSAADVDRTCEAMVAAGTTFRDSLIPWLSPGESAVLHAVARDRPRLLRDLRAALAGELEETAISDALEHLREMGLVAHSRGHETITIRLLAEWIRIHGVSQPHAQRRKRDRRLVIAASAAAALLLVGGAYLVWLRDRMITTSELPDNNGCSYRFKHPERAAQGDTVKLYVFRECSAPTDAAIVLGEMNATVATIDARPLKFVKRGVHSERADVSISLEQPDAAGTSYRFSLEQDATTGAPRIGELVIIHDATPGIRRILERAAEVAMAMLSFVLLGVAVQRRALTVLRRAIRVVRPGVRSAKAKTASAP
jgi:hypothetical protein